jgi:hypothetical protein
MLKVAFWEELRFAKRQQWAVTTTAMTPIAGALTAWRIIWIVAAGGRWLLYSPWP